MRPLRAGAAASLAIAVGLATAAVAHAGAATEAVALVASGPSRIHFTVEVPEPQLLPAEDDAGRVRLDLADYSTDGVPGTPALPVRIVLVAVPPSGPVTVRAVAGGTRTLDGVDLAPIGFVARGEEDKPAVAVQAPRGAVDPSPAVARLLDVSWMRNQRVARVAITPAAYSAAERRLTMARQVDVEIGVAQGPDFPLGPPDRFESVYAQSLINYEQGKRWRRSPPNATGGLLAPSSITDGAPPARGVLTGRKWIRIGASSRGFYKVDFGQVRALALFSGATDVKVDSLRLFAWPGFPVLPESTYCDGCDYREVAIGVQDDGDGVFDDNRADAFYFYGLGASDWANVFDSTRPDTTFINHPYETKSFYYLTISTAADPIPGPFLRIQNTNGAVAVDGDEQIPDLFNDRVHQELDIEYLPDAIPAGWSAFWEKFFWQSLAAGSAFRANFDLPGADTTVATRLRLRLHGLTSVDTCLRPFNPPDHLVDLTVNTTSLGRFGWERERHSGNPFFGTELPYTIDVNVTGLHTAGNGVTASIPLLTTQCPTRKDRIAVAWYDVFYKRRFEPVDDQLTFESATPGHKIYRMFPFTRATPPRVFDVSDPFSVREILGFQYTDTAGAHRLAFEVNESGPSRYVVVRDTNIVKLPQGNIVSLPTVTDLRGTSHVGDYMVIYYDGFLAAADSLAAWRYHFNSVDTTTVPVSTLYDQFSGGRTDPAAIRNFLRAAYQNWNRPPTFVTLLGDASYDFKNLTGRALAGQPGTLVPSFENNYDRSVARTYATDDWLFNVDTAEVIIPDFFGGRIPAADAATALDVVRNKILLYDRSAPLGDYRNRLMLIADDNEQGSSDDPLHWVHLSQSAELDSSITPIHMDRVYVYLHTYPDGAGDTKPGARNDIRATLNGDGVALFNYVGHGSPFKLSDESVFLDTDVGTLTNATKLPMFVAASCDIGKYNDPAVLSLGERLVLRSGGGAVAVISATEFSLSNQNARLNRDLYANLFARGPSGEYETPVSEALLTGKSGSTNSQKYQLMGDALTRLNLPQRWVDLTLYDSTGVTPVADLQQGQTVVFRGRVLDRPGGAVAPADGTVSLLIEDSAPLQKSPPCVLAPACTQATYYYKAGPIFRGDAAVHGSAFEGRFVVPLDAAIGPRARLRGYVSGSPGASSERVDGAGAIRVAVVPGLAPAGDNEGPRITLSFAGGATSVRPDAVLQIGLHDPSGILTTGHNAQNGIVVTIDDNTTRRVDVTPSFRYAADSYQSGTASFRLPGLSSGSHRIKVSAADNFAAGLGAGAHRASTTIDFEVVDVPKLHISQAYLFPNPTRSGGPGSGGRFVIDAPGDSVNVLLRIYTVSGKLIRTLRSFGGIGQIQLAWDGRDDEGFRLGNGVYLFKVHANVREDDGSSSAQQEAAAEGRIVIVGRD